MRGRLSRRRGSPTKQPSRSFATRPRGSRSGNNIKKNRTRSGPVNVAEARRRAGARTVKGGRPVGASPGGPKLAKKKKPISVADLRKKAGARTFRGKPIGASPRPGSRRRATPVKKATPTRGRGGAVSREELFRRARATGGVVRGGRGNRIIADFRKKPSPKGRGGPMRSRGPLPKSKPLTPAQRAAAQKALEARKKSVTVSKKTPKRIPRRRATPVKKAAPSRAIKRGIPRRRVTPVRRKP